MSSTEDAFPVSKVAWGSIHLVLANVISTIIGVLGLAYLARYVTQEEMGILAAITFIGSLVQLVSDFGLSPSLSKHVSELKGRGEEVSKHFFASLLFKMPLALFLCLSLFVFSDEVSLILFDATTNKEMLQLAALYAFFFSMSLPFNHVLVGLGKLKRLALCEIMAIATRWLTVVLFIWVGYGFSGAIFGYITGSVTRLFLYSISSIKLVRFEENLFKNSVKIIPKLIMFSWPLFLSSMVTFLYTWYDRALILAFFPLTELGIYEVSYKAFTVLAGVATSLGRSLFPYYGMAYGKKDHEAINKGLKIASKYTMMIIFPLTLGLFSTAKAAITLFGGQQYESGWGILAILSVFGLTYGILPAISGLLLIHKKTKTMLLLSFVPVVVSLGLLPTLWILGLNGLALVRGASLLLTLFLTMYFLSQVVRIEIEKQAFLKILTSSVIMAVAVTIIQQVYYSKFLLPIYVFIGAIVYIVGLRLLKVLEKADFQLLHQIFGSKVAKFAEIFLGYSDKD